MSQPASPALYMSLPPWQIRSQLLAKSLGKNFPLNLRNYARKRGAPGAILISRFLNVCYPESAWTRKLTFHCGCELNQHEQRLFVPIAPKTFRRY